MKIAGVILAAGQGTRMKSSRPKVLHTLLGKPMIRYSVDAVSQVTGEKAYVVLGFGAEEIRADLGDHVEYVIQEPQLGTGHAVQQVESYLEGKVDLVLVTLADMPLITRETMESLLQSHQSNPGPMTMLTMIADDSRGFGRVIRDPAGNVNAVVEEVQASPEQLRLRELNTSVYCFAADWLWSALRRIPLSPKGEHYLTDLVGIAFSEGLPVNAVQLTDPDEAIGINNRIHLAEAHGILQRKINQRLMLSGVTLIDPGTAFIESSVTIGQDTIIWPNTFLHGDTVIGEGCTIGPNAIIKDSNIGDRSEVVGSVLEGAVLEQDVRIGPFGRLRSGSHLGHGVHMGNFGEVKNSYLGPGTRMGHFSYIGDATIGPDVNIGAGTITCNFDGLRKNHTDIEGGAFIGSDTMLVAPVKIGEGAHTGAGSVVTKDVPAHTLAVGMPARQIRKLDKRD